MSEFPVDVNGRHRVTLRLSNRDFGKLEHWAAQAGASIPEFIVMMLDQWIDIKNGNYELPTLEIYRLNQLIDMITTVSRNQHSLESIIINGFSSLTSLTQGDNYLLEAGDDGELG